MRIRPSLLLVLVISCGPKEPSAVAPAAAPASAASAAKAGVERDNPLLTPSDLPLGYPPFDRLSEADFRPAYDAGMAEHRAEVRAIIDNPEPATFENTLVAMERAGATLMRAMRAFENINASNTSDALQQLEAELSPQLAEHFDAIRLDAGLYARIRSVYEQRDALALDPESRQLLERVHSDFVRAGANLGEADKARLMAINARLSTLGTSFEQHTRDAMTDGGVVVDRLAELDGLSEGQLAAAGEAASRRGLAGKWVITLQNTTTQPALANLNNRTLRERIFRASTSRAAGGPGDNTAILVEMADLRAQKAALLGYPNFASWALTDGTAKKPENVDRILREVGAAALKQARAEAADLQDIIDREARARKLTPFELEPWDWAYYAEKDRKERFDFDEAAVKPYFEMEHVLVDGVFYAATQLYGITFQERHDLPVYHPSVRVFEVRNEDGSMVGLFLVDWFQRGNKQGGAWMSNFVDQSHLLDTRPVITNNLNVPPVAEGQPVLMTLDEVNTAFHEFGHALHGLFADSRYPSLSGTATPPDFVEYPSQFNEMWAYDPKVLANYARHYQTGEVMPRDLLDRVVQAQSYGGGYAALEYIQAAQIDVAWHVLGVGQAPAADAVLAFEDAALQRAGTWFAPVPPRYHSPYFSHIFTGGGYEAGYYAYLWSEVLARDTGAWFTERGGLTRNNGDTYRSLILSRGRTQEPDQLFAAFYGKEPDVGPLLEYRGLTAPQ